MAKYHLLLNKTTTAPVTWHFEILEEAKLEERRTLEHSGALLESRISESHDLGMLEKKKVEMLIKNFEKSDNAFNRNVYKESLPSDGEIYAQRSRIMIQCQPVVDRGTTGFYNYPSEEERKEHDKRYAEIGARVAKEAKITKETKEFKR